MPKLFEKQYGWYTLKVNNQQLYEATKVLILSYLELITEKKNKSYYLLDAFLPIEYINWVSKIGVKNIKNIIVLRDPRDRYIGELNYCEQNNTTSIVPTDVEVYCDNYLRAMQLLETVDSEAYLLIYFEDLIEKYDKSVKAIEDYLELDANCHNVNKGKYLNIEMSKNNCRMYKNSEYKEKYHREIKLIETRLKKYCNEYR